MGNFFLVGLGGDRDDIGQHHIFQLGIVILCQQQILDGDQADELALFIGDIAGINGLLIHALAADAEDRLSHIHAGPQGNILRGHDGTGGIVGVAQDLVDGFAHFRIRLFQDPLDHIGGHLFYQVRRVIHVQLIHDFFQLIVREATDQQFLGIGLHFHKGLRRLLLGQQAEHQRDLVLFQVLKNGRHVTGVHGSQDIPQGNILLLLKHFDEGFFYDFKTFCHQFSSYSRYFTIWKQLSAVEYYGAATDAAGLLLRPGILPLLPASMMFPPFSHSCFYFSGNFQKCQP